MVQRETIERICADVTQLPERTIEAEFDRFFVAQAPICEFLMETLAAGSQRGRELALFLSYVVFKAMSTDSGVPGSVDADAISRAAQDARKWIERIDEFDWKAQAPPQSSEGGWGPLGDEPYLVSFVAAEIEDADVLAKGEEDVLAGGEGDVLAGGEGDVLAGGEEKGLLMFALQTVILSMTGNGRAFSSADAE